MPKPKDTTPTMEKTSLFFLLFTLALLLVFPQISGAIYDNDLKNALATLRTTGRNLFANAILTSDIRYRIASIENASFTLLAPPDADVLSLDLASTGSDYVRTLRRHVLLRSFSIADLIGLPIGSNLETMIPGMDVPIGRWNGSEVVTVDGVGIFVPDLYVSVNLCIHGLERVLSCGSGGSGWNLTVEDGYWSVVGDSERLHSSMSNPMIPEVISTPPVTSVTVLSPPPVGNSEEFSPSPGSDVEEISPSLVPISEGISISPVPYVEEIPPVPAVDVISTPTPVVYHTPVSSRKHPGVRGRMHHRRQRKRSSVVREQSSVHDDWMEYL